MKKILTLAYLISDNQICLGLKKRGFGSGNWNGYGGKVEEGETILKTALRELEEESGVIASSEDLEKVAVIEFFFKDGMHLEVHAFFIRRWEGEPSETEEMQPEWFSFTEIPYQKMWADDPFWLPRAFAGEKLIGKIWFKGDGASIENMEWNTVRDFN